MSWKKPQDANAKPAGSPAGTGKQQPEKAPMFIAKPKPILPPARSDALGDLGFGNAEPQPMTIVQLSVENVKRIKTVRIEPDGNVVVLSGRNGQGKTSVLDAIEYALGGKPDVSEPIRRGEDHARVVCDLGDIIVTRKWTKKGTTLEVGTKDGRTYSSPQAVLDDLVGRLSFDPLAFARMKPKDQAAQLQALVGLDFTAFEKDRDLAYTSRTLANREVKALQTRVDAFTPHAGVLDAEVSVVDLQAQIATANEHNDNVRACQRDLEDSRHRIQRNYEAIEELRSKIAALENENVTLQQQVKEASDYLAENKPVDTSAIVAQIGQVSDINAKVRANQSWRELAHDLDKKRAEADRYTARIEEIDAAKAEAIAAAKMPVAGLGFGEDGVTYQGLPLQQASGAEQLRVSVAIACTMNPQLRVILIRDASLLDQDSLRMVAEMAAQHGTQVWLERVETDEATTVVIEDGEAREVVA
jgi:energy-coupling factor transporter ATP-binding protein EcfA2